MAISYIARWQQRIIQWVKVNNLTINQLNVIWLRDGNTILARLVKVNNLTSNQLGLLAKIP